MARLIALDDLNLASGAQHGTDDRFCVMEAASVYDPEAGALKVNGVTITDHPKDVSTVIRNFLIGWNDSLPDAERQLLKPYIAKVRGTRTNEKDELRRSRMAIDWIARVYTPAWLELAGLDEHARVLRGLSELVDLKSTRAAQPALDAAQKDASAAWSAARSAAESAAWSAARSAAESAAESAARSAAESAERKHQNKKLTRMLRKALGVR